jgi:hypothetical protein
LEQIVAAAPATERRRINALESQIYRLPPEILSVVASYLPKQALIKASHVSYHWRTVLLASPSLWADLNFHHKRELPAFLERSKSAPIHVAMDKDCTGSYAAFAFLKQHATRIETLVISGLEFSVRNSLPPMPNLRKLDIFFKSNGSRDPLHKIDDRANAKWILPAVTTLIVQGGDAFPFDVPQLTQLQVHSREILAIDKLLHFLNRCPLLEELEVAYERSVHTSRTRETAELPNLRLYNYHTTKNEYLGLLNKLRLPPSCSVVFNYWNGSAAVHQVNHDIPFYNPSPLSEIKRINLKAVGQTGGSIDATVELMDVRSYRVFMVRNVGRSRRVGWIDDHGVVDNLYVAYLKGLDTRAVTILCIESSYRWDLNSAQEVLSCLEGIRMLVLSGPVVAPCVHALCPMAEGDPEYPDPSRWRCPKLDTLVIRSPSLFWCNPMDDIMRYLPAIAQERKAAGMPFKSISLFISSPWDENGNGPMESCSSLEVLRGCVERFEIVLGDDALDWNADDYFFDGLSIRRDRYIFPEDNRCRQSLTRSNVDGDLYHPRLFRPQSEYY